MIKPLALSLFLTFASLASSQTVDVYFGTVGSRSEGIYQAKFDATKGELSEPKLAAAIGSPGFLGLDQSQTHLYAVAQLDQAVVAAYKIGPAGQLEFLNAEPTGDGGGAHISVHPSGKFLMTAQYGGGSVGVFPIARDGTVQAQTQLIEHHGGSGVVANRQSRPHPHWTGYSPDGRYAFVPDLGLDQIIIYKVDASIPRITPHGHAQAHPGSGPRHMRFSIDGKFIYLLNELTQTVSTFTYDPETAATELISTTPTLSEEAKVKEASSSSSEILVHPNGKFVYSANRGHDSVTAFLANPATGQLTVTEVEPVRGSTPRNINLDPSAKWLLAAGQWSNTISVFAIDQQTGELTFQTRSIINVPTPICILFKE